MEEFTPLKFVSSKIISREREQTQDARETILKDAERKFLNKQARQQEMVARGDDKWMLPQLDQHIEKSKKKKKKSKKEKKSKSKKKKKKSSSSSESESDDEWVESGANKSKPAEVSEPEKDAEEKSAPKRDEWMDFGALATFSKKEIISDKEKKRQEERKKREEAFALGKSKYELNPYFANGGDGMPAEKPQPTVPKSTNDHAKVAWLLKSFKRAEEQAKEQDVSIEEIAEKRWGSLDKFNAMLDKARGKTGESGQQDRGVKRDNRDLKRRSRERSRERRRSRSVERSKEENRSDRKRSRERKRSRSRDRSRERRRSRSEERSKRRDRSRERRSRSGDRSWREKDMSERSKLKFARPSEDARRSTNTGMKSFSTHSSGGSWKTNDRRDKEREKDREAYRKQEEDRKEREKKESSSSSSDSEPENDKAKEKVENVEEEQRPVIMSAKDLNALAAKIVKAEIMGNDEVAEQLKAKLTAARDARAKIVANGGNPDEMEEKVEIVTKIKRDTPGMSGRVRKTKVETHEGGQRVRYFGDDDKYDLKQMFEREKMDTAEDQNGLFSRLAGKAEHEKATDEWDMDDMLVDKAAGKQNSQQENEKRVNKALSEQISHDKTLEDCKWCIGSRRSNKHLMISMGKSVYLAVPGHTSLVEGHCLIVPMGHCSAGTALDEDVWQEVQEFRKALTRMFNAQGEDCVFFETAMGLKKKPHMVIECAPMEREMGDLAPMYFQKAIQECETEWANNIKLIKLKEKNIARSVPKGLPYFHVDFGMDCGFAHVIEDEPAFSKRFAHEIIGGMLDVEARTFRNPMWEQFDAQKQKVIGFGNMWKDFDWTKTLAPAKDDSSSSDSD